MHVNRMRWGRHVQLYYYMATHTGSVPVHYGECAGSFGASDLCSCKRFSRTKTQKYALRTSHYGVRNVFFDQHIHPRSVEWDADQDIRDAGTPLQC